jgi:uncharacterized protein (TIGR02996 family)
MATKRAKPVVVVDAEAPKPKKVTRMKRKAALSSEEEKLISMLGDPDGRMVYADWLEERSHTRQAAIVRLQDRILTRAEESERLHAKKGMWGETRASRKKPSKLTTTERTILDDGVELMREYLELEKSDASSAVWAERLTAPYPLIDSYWFGVESDKTRKGIHFKKTKKQWETRQEKTIEPEVLAKMTDKRPSAWAISPGLVVHLLNYMSGTSGYSNGVWRQVGPVMTFNLNQGYAYYVAVLFSANRIYGSAHNRNDHGWSWRVARVTQEQYENTDDED